MILTNATVKGNPFTPLSWRWEAAEQLLRQPDRNLAPQGTLRMLLPRIGQPVRFQPHPFRVQSIASVPIGAQ